MKIRFLLFLLCVVAFAQRAMHNNDVVRLVRQGTPPTEIIRRINASASKFTLFDEDVRALGGDGVPEIVIRAMFARQTGDTLIPYESGTTPTSSAAPGAKTPIASDAAPHMQPARILPGKANDELTVTSIPVGATVEWNRKVIGTTPLTYKVGEYAFNARKITIFSKRLLQPVVLRVSKAGYITRELAIAQQMFWRSLNGKNQFTYFIVTSNTFDINLDKLSTVPTSLTNADVIKLKAAGFGDDLIIDKINNTPTAFSLEFGDFLELRKAEIPDAVIQAMMHAK